MKRSRLVSKFADPSASTKRLLNQQYREYDRPLPVVLWHFVTGLIGLASLCALIEVLYRTVLQPHREPYISPLLREYFPDFVFFTPRFDFFHSLGFFTYQSLWPFMYPAPVAVVYKLFYVVPHPLAAFLGFAIAVWIVAALLCGRLLWMIGINRKSAFLFPFLVLLFSYPVWFAFKQANMEILIWTVVASGLGLFLLGRGYSAAACFGLAAAMKIFPFVYFGLLLVRRQYRQIVVGVCVAVTATLGSLWLVYPHVSVSWRYINMGIEGFRVRYMLHKAPEIGFDHSIFAIVKLVIRPLPPPQALAHYLSVYLAVSAIMGVVLFFVRIRFLPVVNQILCLTIASILFPPVSFEYTLLHLLVPGVLIVLLQIESEVNEKPVGGIGLALLCFLVLLAPIPEVIVSAHRIEGQIKCLTLIGLFAIALSRPFPLSTEAWVAERV